MFRQHDISRDACQLFGGQAKRGYDWWWHSFTGRHAVTGEEKPFFIEFFLCNPAYGGEVPKFGQLGDMPSYLMVKAVPGVKTQPNCTAFSTGTKST